MQGPAIGRPDTGVGPDAFIPDNQEHLRAWLLVYIGHVQPSHVFRFASKKEAQWAKGLFIEMMRADRTRGVYGWPQERDGGMAIIYPASIAVYGSQKISEKKFRAITEAVFKAVYDLTGIDFEQWKAEGRKAA